MTDPNAIKNISQLDPVTDQDTCRHTGHIAKILEARRVEEGGSLLTTPVETDTMIVQGLLVSGQGNITYCSVGQWH